MKNLNLNGILAAVIFDYKDKIFFGQVNSYFNKISVDHIPEDYDCAHLVIMKKEDMHDFLSDLLRKIEKEYENKSLSQIQPM